MHKKDAFLFMFAIFFVTLGVWVMGAEAEKTAMNRARFAQPAALYNTSVNSYQTISNTKNENDALASFAKAEKSGQTFSAKTISGTLYVTHEDKKNPVEGEDIYKGFVKTSDGIYELKNISYVPLSPKLNGAKISLSGFGSESKSRGKELLVNLNPSDIRNIKGVRPTPKRLTPGNRSATCAGNFCAIVFPLDTLGATASLPTRADMESYLFNGRIKSGFSEESYNLVEYGGTVTDWINVSSPNVEIFSAPSEVAQYISTNGLNLSAYDQVVFLVNGGEDSAGGLASIGATAFDVGGVIYNIPVARVGFSQYEHNGDLTMANGNLSYFDHLYMHETMHNLGSEHDNLENCKSGPVSAPSDCIFIEYGNNFSTMGGGYLGAHPSFLNKLRMGWISSSNIHYSANGSQTLNPVEVLNPSYLALDYGLNGVPEYVFERRSSAGLDTTSLFPNTNLAGAFVYRMFPDYGFANVSTDPYQWHLNLVDTSPAGRSSGWPAALYDSVLKIPQRFADAVRGLAFRQSAGGGNNVVEIYPVPAAATCSMKPVKVFEPTDANDTFTGQVGTQKWPVIAASPFSGNTQTLHADVTDPTAEVLLYKTIMVFNDDTLPCLPSDYTFKFKFAGAELPLISDTSAQYPAWGGPYYQTIFAFLPVSGLTYGSQTVTLEVTKLNDGTIFSKNLVFNLAP